MKNRQKNAMRIFLFLTLGTLFSFAEIRGQASRSAAPAYLYKTTFVRAAPGKLLDLIALYKDRMAVIEAAGDERPLWWRHTQGDQWDLMLLFPMGSYTEYYSSERISRRQKAAVAASFSTSSRGAKMTWEVPSCRRRFKQYSRQASGNRERRPVSAGGRPA